MNKRTTYILLFSIATLISLGLGYLFLSSEITVSRFDKIDRYPQIDPDYTETIIPPNMAPLNFTIKESGSRYLVKIYSNSGDTIKISDSEPKVLIPLNHWKKLLAQNRNHALFFDLFVADENGLWHKYKTIKNQIAAEELDNYLAYRLIKVVYSRTKNIGIYQRNLQNFDESLVYHSRTLNRGCMNCHTFYNYDSDKMMMHLRGGPGTGMLLAQNGRAVKVDTRTEFNPSHTAYPAWHPNGNILAMSINRVTQFFHSIGEIRDVFDWKSYMLLYEVDTNTITTSPKIANPERMEIFPTWSPDGKYLYFCSAPRYKIDSTGALPYTDIKYDLKRISYDAEKRSWGELETVLPVSKTGLSITQPRISPDGRFLLCCMSDYSNFPAYRTSSDLYLLNLETGEYHKPDINSERAESWHNWSSNSRWILFCSKRRDGQRSRIYFSYVDENGKAHKPFLLPQKNPEFYATFFKTYNLPEFLKGPVKLSSRELSRAAFDNTNILKAKLDPNVKIRIDPAKINPAWKTGGPY